MIFNTTTKSLLSSFIIHTLVIGGYFIFTYEEPVKTASKEKIISMDLQTIELPKQNKIKPKPEPIKKTTPKKIEKVQKKPKPLQKVEPKYKPIIQEKPKPKKQVIKKTKEVKKETKVIKKPKPIQDKKVVKPVKTKAIANIQKQQQSFKKTNFAIIRDLVLSNLNYPTIAKKMGWQGVVKVKLVIDINGKLIDYEVIKSSNRKQLDRAAFEAVESIVNTTLPKPKTKTTLILPISFRLQ